MNAEILLLHNYEDLLGLLEVSEILTYIDLFKYGVKEEIFLTQNQSKG